MFILINAACTNHEQLQEDEKWRHDEAIERVTCLLVLCQFLAKQHLTHQFEAEHGEHPKQTQHSQPLLTFLIQADGDNGCEVGAEAVCGKQRHEHKPPAQVNQQVHAQSHKHAEYQQSGKVEEELEGGKAEPLDQLTQREKHGLVELALL